MIAFNGQVAVVTGAGRGLGRAYAMELARRGAAVVVNDIGLSAEGASRAEETVTDILSEGGKAVASRHDITTPEGGQGLIDAAAQAFGTLDILINNAGFLRPGLFDNMQMSEVSEIVGVHLLGAFHTTLPAWRIMREKNYGRIVLTGSGSSFGHAGNGNYSAAKSAMIGLTQSLALEARGTGIQANCIFPVAEGQIMADNPLSGPGVERLMKALSVMKGRRPPESVAHLVVYLSSRECTHSGRIYSALAGRYGRVFMGVADGYFTPDASALSVEEIARHMDQIDDLSTFTTPESIIEEIETVADRIIAASTTSTTLTNI